MKFGEALRYYRIKNGLTQGDMAGKLKVHRQTYCNYETGKRLPDLYKVYEISKILNVSIDEIMRKVYEG